MTTRRVMLPLMRESCMAALRAEFEAHARRLLGATSASILSPMPGGFVVSLPAALCASCMHVGACLPVL